MQWRGRGAGPVPVPNSSSRYTLFCSVNYNSVTLHQSANRILHSKLNFNCQLHFVTRRTKIRSFSKILKAELGTRQHCRENVVMFSGQKMVDNCILTIFVVATPCKHRGLHIFLIFLVTKAIFRVIVLSLSRAHLWLKEHKAAVKWFYNLPIYQIVTRRVCWRTHRWTASSSPWSPAGPLTGSYSSTYTRLTSQVGLSGSYSSTYTRLTYQVGLTGSYSSTYTRLTYQVELTKAQVLLTNCTKEEEESAILDGRGRMEQDLLLYMSIGIKIKTKLRLRKTRSENSYMY